jgi:HEAT repeat protein
MTTTTDTRDELLERAARYRWLAREARLFAPGPAGNAAHNDWIAVAVELEQQAEAAA